jgi:hypothetical protein
VIIGNSGLFPELGYLIPFVVHKVLFPIDPGPTVKKEKARTSQHWILGFPLSLSLESGLQFIFG